MTTHQHRPSPGEFPGVDWVRRNKLTAGIIAGAVAVILVAVIVVATGAGSSSGTSAAAKTPPKAAATKGSQWIDGAGNTNLTAVNGALIALTVAKTKGDAPAAAAAGARLVATSTAALHGAMPPVAAGTYRTALAHLIAAGHAASAGRLGAAAPLINDGIAGLTEVTASNNAPKGA